VAKRQRKFRLEIEDVNGNIQKIYDPFTVDFDIEKGILSKVCQASFTVYNLKETTRNYIYKDLLDIEMGKRRTIAFFAGHEGEGEPSRVFRGTVNQCYHYRKGVDFMTVIEADSGSDYLANGYVSAQIPAGAGIKDAVIEMLDQIKVGTTARYIGNFEGTFKRATALTGNFDELVRQYTGGHFFIDDGDFFCLKDNECINGVLNKIDAESGLLGSPQREESYITFEMLFEPRIMMGQWIVLESTTNKFMNGTYKVLGVHHSGTISGAICGTAKTTVRVWAQPFVIELVKRS